MDPSCSPLILKSLPPLHLFTRALPWSAPSHGKSLSPLKSWPSGLSLPEARVYSPGLGREALLPPPSSVLRPPRMPCPGLCNVNFRILRLVLLCNRELPEGRVRGLFILASALRGPGTQQLFNKHLRPGLNYVKLKTSL